MNEPHAAPRHDRPLPPRGQHPYQLYSCGTPNGQKITIMLEELRDVDPTVEYDAWFIDLSKGDQFGKQFTALSKGRMGWGWGMGDGMVDGGWDGGWDGWMGWWMNLYSPSLHTDPNQKIPVLAHYVVGSNEPPIRVFEGGHICLYLSQLHGDAFLPKDKRQRTECLNWVFWLQSSAPNLGAFGQFFHYAPVRIEFAINRYATEVKRLYDVLDRQLQASGGPWILGSFFSIADIVAAPWFLAVPRGYTGSEEFLGLKKYQYVQQWLARFVQRPAVKRGLRVNGFGQKAIRERHSAADLTDTNAKL